MKTLPSPPTPRSGKRPNGKQKADAPGSGCTLPSGMHAQKMPVERLAKPIARLPCAIQNFHFRLFSKLHGQALPETSSVHREANAHSAASEGAVVTSYSRLVFTATCCASAEPETSKSNMNSCFFILLVYLKQTGNPFINRSKVSPTDRRGSSG